VVRPMALRPISTGPSQRKGNTRTPKIGACRQRRVSTPPPGSVVNRAVAMTALCYQSVFKYSSRSASSPSVSSPRPEAASALWGPARASRNVLERPS